MKHFTIFYRLISILHHRWRERKQSLRNFTFLFKSPSTVVVTILITIAMNQLHVYCPYFLLSFSLIFLWRFPSQFRIGDLKQDFFLINLAIGLLSFHLVRLFCVCFSIALRSFVVRLLWAQHTKPSYTLNHNHLEQIYFSKLVSSSTNIEPDPNEY